MSEAKMIHISYGGPIYEIYDQTGKRWVFEMHRYCGPAVLRGDLEPRVRQPAEKSPFWEVVSQWAQQGQKSKKVGIHDCCVYDPDIPIK